METLNKLIIGATIVIASQVSLANNCEKLEKISALIMEVRQSGAGISEVLDIFEQNPLIKPLIIKAYDVPQYGTRKYKTRAVQKFKNDTALECYKRSKTI